MSSAFLAALNAVPIGYSEGRYEGRRYGVVLQSSDDGRRISFFARELGGTDIVSFNLFTLKSGVATLKPCEMSKQKVVAFVLTYVSDVSTTQ